MPQTRESYEQFLYGISEQSDYIRHSDLVLIPTGKTLCVVKGNIYYDESIRLEIREVLDFASDEWITTYSYTVYREDEKLCWYDSQGHPNDPTLQSTHPHHKHVHPDIKHHRIPAPSLSFKEPNLPFLIREIEEQYF